MFNDDLDAMDPPSREALRLAALKLIDQLGPFTSRIERPQPIFDVHCLPLIDELELSLRCANRLKGLQIFTIDALIHCTEAELLQRPELNRSNLDEIQGALAHRGLKLGTRLEGWPPTGLDKR